MLPILPPPADSDPKLDYCLTMASRLETYISDLKRKARTTQDYTYIKLQQEKMKVYTDILSRYGL